MSELTDIDPSDEAIEITQASGASYDGDQIDRLASRLMLELKAYQHGRDVGLAVVYQLRSHARRAREGGARGAQM